MILQSQDDLGDGRSVARWEMRNDAGATASVMALGATLLSVKVPDRNGRLDDVTFGHARLADHFLGRHFLGPVVGRFANRLAGGAFEIDGRRYQLPRNDGPNALHGGPDGFDRRMWAGVVVETPDGEGVCLRLRSEQGDQGYPGTLAASITFVWTADNRLITDFTATTDKPTPLNLTLHGYWNLASPGAGQGIGDHLLEIAAGAYLPVDSTGVCTGEIRAVDATRFDFRTPQGLGQRLQSLRMEPGCEGGYDHCWAIAGTGLRRAAVLYHPDSGRELTIETDQPGLQVYTANHFNATVPGRDGRVSAPHCAIALETQTFPDAPNQPAFPDAILRPGQRWRSRTVYSFRVR